MKLLIAPDSFSGFDSAPGIVARASEVLEPLGISCIGLPMADGGEGTTLVLLNQLTAQTSGHEVSGPLGDPVHAPVLSFEGGHFIEAARAVGRSLFRGPLDRPWQVSSYGLGEVLSAMDMEHEEGPLMVGLGGSACFDGGLGLAQALGLQVLDAEGNRLPPISGAEAMERAVRLEGEVPLEDRLVCGWVDVEANLEEAVPAFGPDKGFQKNDHPRLLAGLQNWSRVVNEWRERLHLTPVDPCGQGTGAAGGLGFALRALLDSPLLPGASAIGQRLNLREALRSCDAVLTGEGRVDASSFQGKVVGCVSTLARQCDTPVYVLTGQVRGPLPLPPVGPDKIFACEDAQDPNWDTAFVSTVKRLAEHLRDG